MKKFQNDLSVHKKHKGENMIAYMSQCLEYSKSESPPTGLSQKGIATQAYDI